MQIMQTQKYTACYGCAALEFCEKVQDQWFCQDCSFDAAAFLTEKTMQTSISQYHIRLKINGSIANQTLFHELLRDLDSDYPYRLEISKNSKIGVCTSCKGILWDRPMLTTGELRCAAFQCGVNIKVSHFAPKCVNHTMVPTDIAELQPYKEFIG